MATTMGESFSRMLEEVGFKREEPPPHVRLRPLSNPAYQIQFVSDPARPLTAETLGGLYLEELVYDAETMGDTPPPATSTDPQEIAAELGITGTTSLEELHRLRRRFALSNHPDRLAPIYRETATRRMMIANRLIDDAIFHRT